MQKKKLLNWAVANKIAIIFTLLSGIILFFTLLLPLLKPKERLKSTISINEFEVPVDFEKYSYDSYISELLPETLEKNKLSELLSDSLELLKIIDSSNSYKVNYRIYKSIPDENTPYSLTNNLDSLIEALVYPISETDYFFSVSIENNGGKIVNNVRFESPTYGYYEVYENDNFVKAGDFKNNIIIGSIRPDNTFTIKAWCFSYFSSSHVRISDDVKITYENGSLKPSVTEPLVLNNFVHFIVFNPIMSFFMFLLIVSWILYMITLYVPMNIKKKENNNP